MRKHAVIIGSASLCLLVLAAWLARHPRERFSPAADRLILLVPDETNLSDPRVTVWLDAASEEGLHVVPMHDSSFLRPLFGRPQCAGVILPDSVHEQAGDLFVGAMREYVAAGGSLMVVYDAATKSLQGFYPGSRSRLSDLAGVNYALYTALGGAMIQARDVGGAIPVLDQLGVPPGKYYPFLPSKLTKSGASGGGSDEAQLRRYLHGSLQYASFVTSGDYSGRVLLRSSAGIVAGERRYEKGSVLFVNIPLGYLKGNTDGLLLHAFLKYFAVHLLSLPYLVSVPDGVGGLVLNWHVDSNAAISALQEMNTWTMLQQGPYSIHITAGPDTYAFGDKQGFDVLHRAASQLLVHEYTNLGHEIGSHGGWIHNYFATHVDTDDPKEMEKFLELNRSALEQVTGRPVVEYSAPNGNQPEWVTKWLELHGFVAYYFTGDTGMGPTQGYRVGRREGQSIWAFPIAQMDRAASFEELRGEDVSFEVIEQWLEALTDFVVSHEQVRLTYFHPPGILPFRKEVDGWMHKTMQLKAQGRFRWYTMAQMANFLNSRKKVVWKLNERGGLTSLEAADSQTLAHQAWTFPSEKYGQPTVVRGAATVHQAGASWIVVAGEGNQLTVEARTSSQ